MIKYHEGLVKAQTISTLLMQVLSSVPNLQGHIESYQNGREQGHCLWMHELRHERSCKVSVSNPNGREITELSYIYAQDRHSDGILLYIGKPSFQSVDEQTYREGRNFFKPHDYIEVVKYIITDMEERYRKLGQQVYYTAGTNEALHEQAKYYSGIADSLAKERDNFL